MSLLDIILGNFEENSPERIFSEILKEDYKNRFDADDFDEKFNGVAGYRPVKTAAMKVARNYVDGISDLSDDEKDIIINEFSESYDDANKESINIHAIMDGIINDVLDEVEDEEDDILVDDEADDLIGDDDDVDDDD